MEEKNELNDIILNKNGSSAANKKIVLSVATLGVILIVIIVLMNSLSPRGTGNLPQPVPPPQPIKQTSTPTSIQEPLFEEVPVIEENTSTNKSLDAIAQKLKQESAKEKSVTTAHAKQEIVAETKKEQPKVEPKQKPQIQQEIKKEHPAMSDAKSGYYIQVGSFEKEPSKNMLSAITKLGYKYTFHEVTQNSKKVNKVLVGPFNSDAEAKKALPDIKNSVEKNAFLTKI